MKFTNGLEVIAKANDLQNATAAASKIRPSPTFGDSSRYPGAVHKVAGNNLGSYDFSMNFGKVGRRVSTNTSFRTIAKRDEHLLALARPLAYPASKTGQSW